MLPSQRAEMAKRFEEWRKSICAVGAEASLCVENVLVFLERHRLLNVDAAKAFVAPIHNRKPLQPESD